MSHNEFGGSAVSGDELFGDSRGFGQALRVWRHQAVEYHGQLFTVFNVESASGLLHLDGFAELAVVRAKHHGHTVNGRLQNVVDAHTKSATNIGQFTVFVDARKNTYAVNHQHVGSGSSFGGSLGVAHAFAVQFADNLLHMSLVGLVGSNNNSVVFPVGVFGQQVFVLRP